MVYKFIRPALFCYDGEDAHSASIAALQMLPPVGFAKNDPILQQKFCGLYFASPVGLAPGYDKNAQVAKEILRLGFGFTEVGTLTPLPQQGNDRPRLFRLIEDKAVINRMGFNNEGQAAAIKRLQKLRTARLSGPVGVNIGANKDSADRISDYVLGARAMSPYADYLTINISSPNTAGLRGLQDKGALEELLSAVNAERIAKLPIFLKVAPDLGPREIDDIVEISMKHKIDALIISNTTISRPDSLRSRYAQETGGLSGAPLRDLAQQRLRDFRKSTGGRLPLIGVGGIASAEHAYARIRAGASLVQVYSALVYEGPMLARKINKGLTALLRRDGFYSITQAIGADD